MGRRHCKIDDGIMNSFQIIGRWEVAPIGCKKFTSHLMWYENIYFIRRDQLVLDEHKTLNLIGLNYDGVVSR